MLPEINTLETTTVTISKHACKCSTGNWLIYDRNWLLDNLDAEFRHLQETRAVRALHEKKLKGEVDK